jgi:capsular exopolysaccharide synthesis family protein
VNADSTVQTPQPLDDGLVDYLVGHCNLSQETAAQVREIMRVERVQSSDAAALSGLLTAAQLEEAAKWFAHRSATPNDGIIETALRRSTGKSIVKFRVDGPELKPGRQLLFVHDPYSDRSEKIRALRTELLLVSNSATMSLAVVGSGPEEGRSLLAAELALAFAQLGRRTLLVDADLRNPFQHVLFQTKNTLGLADIIEGRHPGLMYRVAGFPSMVLLAAGSTPANPLELLSDNRFEQLTISWRKEYEFIVLDTPPINRFADGLTIAAAAGRVLVVSRSKASKFKDLKEMLRRLALTQSQVLGAVINDF